MMLNKLRSHFVDRDSVFLSRATIFNSEDSVDFVGQRHSEKEYKRLRILTSEEVTCDFHEPGILTGYRCPETSVWQCFLSLFQLHNETINIWTQIIPALYFILELADNFKTYDLFVMIYLGTSILFLLTSACAHTFNCLSARARHICFFFDYVGLTTYSCGCAVCYYAYALPVELVRSPSFTGSILCDVYLFLSVFVSIWSTYLSCTTRFWEPSMWRKFIRLGAFLLIWIYLTVPVVWRVSSCRYATEENTADCSSSYYWSLQFFSAVTAGFWYVSHLPERFFPGKFDVLGHSHQIFHIFGASAAINQYRALKVDIIERKSYIESMLHNPSLNLSLFCIITVIFSNILIFVSFYRKLCSSDKAKAC